MTGPERTFRRDVGTLLLGSLAAQALAILMLPVLSRLYSPTDFGLLGTYLAIVGALGTLSLLRYDLAIALPEEDGEAAQVLALCLGVLVVFAAVAGVCIWMGRAELAALLKTPALAVCAWMIPLGIVGWGGFQAMSAWASRRGHFKTLSGCIATQALGQSVAQACLRSLGQAGLLAGSLFGQALGLLGLWRRAWKDESPLLCTITLNGVRQAAARYWRFPAVAFWSGLVNVLNLHLPVLLFAGLYGEGFVGLYLLGFRVLQLPLQLLGRSVAQVFFPEAARSHRQEKLAERTKDLFHFLMQMGFPTILLLGAAAPEVFHIVFGAGWEKAGEMAFWLAPWLALVFITSPLSSLPFVVERQGREFGIQVFMLVVRTGALLIGAQAGGEAGALAAFAVAGFVVRSAYLVWLLRTAGVQLSGQWPGIAGPVVEGVAAYCILMAVRHLVPGSLAVLAVAFLAAAYMLLTKVRLVRSHS